LVLHGEVYESNKQHGEEVVNTAGDILLASLVLKGKDKFSVGVNAMLPINQNLSSGNIEANYRWSVNLNYIL
jgi:hypothetical protein